MKKNIIIQWFRQDLRLADNPSLCSAASAGLVLPIYIVDDVNSGDDAMGGASRVWLQHALTSLNQSLDDTLTILSGDPLELIPKLCRDYHVSAVHWNRCYEPWRIQRDKKLKLLLTQMSIDVKTHSGSLLWEPWTIAKSNGDPYRVFTPFYRRGCLSANPPREPLNQPSSLSLHETLPESLSITQCLGLDNKPWVSEITKSWDISEAGGHESLRVFIDDRVNSYRQQRDIPSVQGTSRLSPYLHFGQLSPHQAWHAVSHLPESDGADTFLSELGWREFSYSQLYYHPDLSHENVKKKYDTFPWINDSSVLSAWKKGLTGIPIVDAGMRELYQTGYMHNRVRMIVASFLIKNCMVDWRLGASWFWDCLFDADMASNSASWQWVAGCGADAAPFFRIFNPVTQATKFDPEGIYIKRYCPELSSLDVPDVFAPWEVDPARLASCSVVLGKTYPLPIVDLKQSRLRALEALKSLS